MKLLILGGTVFLGRHIVDAALKRGHEVTLFNRGSSTEEIPGVEQLRGDRNGGLDALKGRKWDVVIDTSGYIPHIVRQSVELLKDQVERYIFISSVSVYQGLEEFDRDEDTPVATISPETVASLPDEEWRQYYGELKALCEQVVEEVMPGRALNIRPGLIVGPRDVTDRFTYWPVRAARGGEILAPLPKERRVQVIDVRDLSEWLVHLAETRTAGTIHTCGAEHTMEEILNTCLRVADNGASLTWVTEEFLNEQEVGDWIELPLWVMPGGPVGLLAVNNSKAFANGLVCRPMEETVRDTLEWDRTRPQDRERRAGMDPERERELLQAWREQQEAESLV